MSQGVLLFAHSSEQVNYGVLACWMASRVKKHLQKPVAVVMDQYTYDGLLQSSIVPKKYFDHIIINEVGDLQFRRLGDEMIPFTNFDRTDAYDLSPFDETLVLDIDIVLQSNRLNCVWNSDYDLLLSNDSFDIFDREHSEFQHLKEHGIKFKWATEFYFKKSPMAENFFNLCKTAKEDYNWKSVLYGFSNWPIRNDFLWSIASHEGNINIPVIPRKLRYSIDRDEVVEMRENEIIIGTQTDRGPKVLNVAGQDIHVMNKYELMILGAIEIGVLL